MKKDIDFPKVEHIGVCAVPTDEGGQTFWKVHVLNLLDAPINNVLIATKGYGNQAEQQVKTSELRHYFESIPPKSERPIEVIPQDLVGLSNQYWVSYYVNERIHDKKFIFLPDTLLEKNLTHIPVLDAMGVLIM